MQCAIDRLLTFLIAGVLRDFSDKITLDIESVL